jgi:hypothetical protein
MVTLLRPLPGCLQRCFHQRNTYHVLLYTLLHTLFSHCLSQLLMEEASKLESAESFSLKKTRDKNSLLDTEMTDWMLNSVQKAQIGETDMCVGCSASIAGRLCGCTVLCVLRGVYYYRGVVRSGDFNTQCLLIF